MLLSPLILIVGIWILVANEGNSIKQHQALREGLGIVVEASTKNGIDDKKDNKLIHLIGIVEPQSSASDYLLGVKPTPANNTIKLRRDVQMYQWVEKSSTDSTKHTGGSSTSRTTYTYEKQWRSEHITSSAFSDPDSHENPKTMKFATTTFDADELKIGEYLLSQDATDKMDGKKWYKQYDQTVKVKNIPDETTRNDAKEFGNGFFFGSDTAYPEVGDLKISYEYIPMQTVSIIARQSADTLAQYTSSKTGGTILIVEPGSHDAKEMFLLEGQRVANNTWSMRVLGFVIVMIAFQMAVAPLSTVADVVPFLGDLLETGTGIFALISATIVTVVIIGFSWLFYRPFFSLILFGVFGVTAYYWKEQKYKNASSSGVGGFYDASAGSGSWTYDMLNSGGV